MFNPAQLDGIVKKRTARGFLRSFIYKLGSTFELLIVLAVWYLIFSNKSDLGGFSREEILSYILIGNIIGLAAYHLLHRIVINDISRHSFALLMDKPVQYITKVLVKGFGRGIFPFIASIGIQVAVLYYFIDNFYFNKDAVYLIVIATMIILAFFIELLILYFFHLLSFWTFESGDSYRFILRLKKIFAGNYFPLSILPFVFLKFSLAFPFAYSFFIPAELYLKKIDLSTGIFGLGVQVIWILVLYVSIKFIWTRKINKERIKTDELQIIKD